MDRLKHNKTLFLSCPAQLSQAASCSLRSSDESQFHFLQGGSSTASNNPHRVGVAATSLIASQQHRATTLGPVLPCDHSRPSTTDNTDMESHLVGAVELGDVSKVLTRAN